LPDFDKIICKVEVSPTNPQPKRGAPRAGANSNLKEPLMRYGVNFAVSVDDIGFTAARDGVRHGHLEEMVAAYDKEGRILNLTKQENKLSIGPEDYSKLRSVGLQLHQEIDVRWARLFCALEFTILIPAMPALLASLWAARLYPEKLANSQDNRDVLCCYVCNL